MRRIGPFSLLIEFMVGFATMALFAGVVAPLFFDIRHPAQAASAQNNFTATAVSDTAVSLAWDFPAAAKTSVTIYRSSGGVFSLLTKLPAGKHLYTDTSCYPATTYSYKLTADDAAGGSTSALTQQATTLSGSGLTTGAAPESGFTAAAASSHTIVVSFSTTTSRGSTWYIERSTDGIHFAVVAVVYSPPLSAVSYTDDCLAPGAVYDYRIRDDESTTGVSDYAAAVHTNTPPRPANAPLEPCSLAATVDSGTHVTINWTDTNGKQASYLIEAAQANNSGDPSLANMKWSEVAQTAVGASSYVLNNANAPNWIFPQNFFYIRIRAHHSGGDSGYAYEASYGAARVRTASQAGITNRTYDIGPGYSFNTLGSFPWISLGSGDTLRIHCNRDQKGNVVPYFEKPLISVRGTAEHPITITGVPDPSTGALPIIDGTHAVTSSKWLPSTLSVEGAGVVLIDATQTNGFRAMGWSPGYIALSNLEIRNGYDGRYDPGNPTVTPTNPAGNLYTFTASDGSKQAYYGTYGIYVVRGDHITISKCIIDGSNGGIFGAGQGDSRNLADITLDSNWIYGNGSVAPDGYGVHGTYIEGIHVTYQFNHYGPMRAGAGGSALKDRSAETVVRYNWIEGGGHVLDLVDASNYAAVTLTLDGYHDTYVYGNVLLPPVLYPGAVVHYGGDQGISANYRKGTLHFYNNTVAFTADNTGLALFQLTTNAESADVRNNIFFWQAATSGKPPPPVQITGGDGSGAGVFYFGRNWITPGWTASGSDPLDGILHGTSNLISNSQNDPGFAKAASHFHLSASSPCLNQADHQESGVPPVRYQYLDPHTSQIRSSIKSLGAFER